MKSNKRGSAGIILIVVAIIAMIIFAAIYLYSNKIPVSNIGTSGENGNVTKTDNVEKQIKVIVDNYDMWTMKNADDLHNPYSYVVTDLDQNGRLEIITSTCQGTGIYTYSKYYEVNKTFDGLDEIKRDLIEGSSEADIGVDTVKVFIDKVNNEYHYIFEDMLRNGAAEYYENKQDIMLKDGKLSENTLAYKTTIYEDAVPKVTYQNTELKEITAKEYEAFEDSKFKDLECKTANIKWITQMGDDLDNASGDALIELLKKSYDGFKFTAFQKSSKDDEENKVRHEAYKNALKDMVESKKLPNDDEIELYYDETMNMEENKFAIYDIDNDGHDELIIEWVTAPTAGQLSFIYDYDVENEKFVTEFTDVPLLTFYDNGVIVALLSHNQGLAGENFWPYFLYKYDEKTDVYNQVAMVDAWDKTVADSDSNGNKYPVDIDKSGDGIVYYIITDGDYDNKVPVSKKDYENWRSSYLDGAKEVKVEYMSLSAKEIGKIK